MLNALLMAHTDNTLYKEIAESYMVYKSEEGPLHFLQRSKCHEFPAGFFVLNAGLSLKWNERNKTKWISNTEIILVKKNYSE